MPMNFTFTWKSAVIFIVGLIVAGVVGELLDNAVGRVVSVGTMVIVILSLSNAERNNPKR
jgi:hypothetical protein